MEERLAYFTSRMEERLADLPLEMNGGETGAYFTSRMEERLADLPLK